MSDRYPPIGDYALLADCYSSALVSRSGSVDWACLRRFDAPSVFARILDWDRGGHFALTVAGGRCSARRYVGDSLVLETTVASDHGTGRIIDAFSMHPGGARRPHNQLLRVVVCDEGDLDVDVVIEPRFDYGELRPWLRDHGDGAYTAVGSDQAIVISAGCALVRDDEQYRFAGRLRLEAGQRGRFSVVAQLPHELDPTPLTGDDIDERLDATLTWWERWSSKTRASGPYAEHVRRSAVVLKGLTCAPTGAVVAAPTTSLPEEVGGERNWDYRYSWVRDSTLVLAAMSVVGHDEVAQGFRDFIMRAAAGKAEDLQIMYDVYGGRYMPERELDLEGYRGSRPVRIGNGAAHQVQHDMYGQIIDAATLWRRTHDGIDPDEWRFLRELVAAAADIWTTPDRGMWEIRGEPQHFVTSKVMCWVALDRGIRTVEETGMDDADVDRWRKVRDEIRASIDAEGVHHDGWFRQAYGVDEVDAGLLLLPLFGFCDARDERMVATVAKIQQDLAGPGGFLHRYRTDVGHDGLAGGEGAFLICTLWLVDVLVMQGRVGEARELFERVLAVGNDVGLFAEEYDSASGQLVGNFPQAFTHLAVIDSAHMLLCADASERHPGAGWDTHTRMAERSF